MLEGTLTITREVTTKNYTFLIEDIKVTGTANYEDQGTGLKLRSTQGYAVISTLTTEEENVDFQNFATFNYSSPGLVNASINEPSYAPRSQEITLAFYEAVNALLKQNNEGSIFDLTD